MVSGWAGLPSVLSCNTGSTQHVHGSGWGQSLRPACPPGCQSSADFRAGCTHTHTHTHTLTHSAPPHRPPHTDGRWDINSRAQPFHTSAGRSSKHHVKFAPSLLRARVCVENSSSEAETVRPEFGFTSKKKKKKLSSSRKQLGLIPAEMAIESSWAVYFSGRGRSV